MEKIRFPIPIKFRNHLEYCSINLSELTRETFLADGKHCFMVSVVPAKSEYLLLFTSDLSRSERSPNVKYRKHENIR